MQKVTLLVVGKLKSSELLSLEADYLKRIKLFELNITELKGQREDIALEAKLIEDKITDLTKSSPGLVILLREKGKEMDSKAFAHWLKEKHETHRHLIFVIGGAAGLSSQLIEKFKTSISLSLLTFPHQLARLIFIEQLFRAQTIQEGHPYHK